MAVMKDSGAQTGYPQHGKRIPIGTAKAAKAPPSLRVIVNRLKWGLPLMRYTQRDPALRAMMLAELVQQNVDQSAAVVLPEGVMVQYITRDRYKAYREALSGLNDENVESVRQKLRELGVLQGGTVVQAPQGALLPEADPDTRMMDGDKREAASTPPEASTATKQSRSNFITGLV